MPRRSVPLVRRLSEPRVRDSIAVHAEHRSVPWPFSFPVPRKNIAGRRNHNARPVLRDRDRRRTASKCVGGNLAHLLLDSSLWRLPSRRQQFENRGLQRKAWIGTTVCTLPSCARRTSFSSAAVSPSCSRQSGAIDSSTSSTPARPRANGWPGRRQSIRADGVPRSRHIRPRRLTRQCLPIGGERR